jgi:hypothetical protein
MEEIKAMLETLVQGCLKARNSEDEKDEKKDDKEEAENKKACNEDVDKRDIIRQIMAIAGKEEASEDVKTIAKLAEKLAYDKSEAGTADNSKKAKNEDEEEYEELEEKTEKAENKKAKNEDEEEKEAENKKAKNSLDEAKKIFFEGTYKAQSKYMTQKEGIELGKELY